MRSNAHPYRENALEGSRREACYVPSPRSATKRRLTSVEWSVSARSIARSSATLASLEVSLLRGLGDRSWAGRRRPPLRITERAVCYGYRLPGGPKE